ncbi:MAG: hypothetical protein HFF36_02555 [Coprobacillus sp.]|nr:hypothetical protein [Coprobacillus sp.]
MKVQAITRFYDLKAKKQREEHDLFEVSSDRAKQLINLDFVKEMEIKKTK